MSSPFSLLAKILLKKASDMATTIVGGKTYVGDSVDIKRDGRLFVDDVYQEGVKLDGVVEVRVVEGVLKNLSVGGNVQCGDVLGNVDAGGNVECGNVRGDVDSGGYVNCNDIGGGVDASGNVSCKGSIAGNVDAGGNVRTGS